MALFGVSSGAVQFMAYEQMKNYAFARKKRNTLAAGGSWKDGEEKLVSGPAPTYLKGPTELIHGTVRVIRHTRSYRLLRNYSLWSQPTPTK